MTIKTFRFKSPTVQAIQWTGDNEEELYEFTESFYLVPEEDRDDLAASGCVLDTRYSTWENVYDNDWIVKFRDGIRISPYREVDFKETFEVVE